MKRVFVLCSAAVMMLGAAAPAMAGDVVDSEGLALQAIAGGNWTQAEAELRAGLKETPNDAMKLLNLAYVLQKTGRAQEAQGIYAQVLVLNDNPLLAIGSGDSVRPERAKLLAKKGMASLK